MGKKAKMPIDLKEYGSGITCFLGYNKNNQWHTNHFEFGSISHQSKKEIFENTRFDIASLTKTFTSILIHKAVEEKLFTFQTKIIDIDCHFQNLGKVTIEDLLCHRVEIWTKGYLGDITTLKEYNQILYSAYLKSPHPKYVDTHYIILSKILEVTYQKTYNELLQEKIIKPLKLTHTSFFLSENDSYTSCDKELRDNKIINIPTQKAHDAKARALVDLSIYPGHAGLFSTSKDLFLVLKSLIDESEKILKNKSKVHFFNHDDYENYIKECQQNQKEIMISLYTYGGMRYKILNEKLNPVRVPCSLDSFLFSGYTGPIYLIDKQMKIIIVLMINSVHFSKKTRAERLEYSMNLISKIYTSIKKEFFM